MFEHTDHYKQLTNQKIGVFTNVVDLSKTGDEPVATGSQPCSLALLHL
jgi:hypothetical protein